MKSLVLFSHARILSRGTHLPRAGGRAANGLSLHSQSMSSQPPAQAYRYQYHFIENTESLEKYRPGGYHPVMLGDILHGRYRVVDKLGYGGFNGLDRARHGETDLCRAENWHRRFTTKRDRCVRPAGRPAFRQTHMPRDHCRARCHSCYSRRIHGDGVNGTHPCYTTSLGQRDLRDASLLHMFKLDVARALCMKLVSAIA